MLTATKIYKGTRYTSTAKISNCSHCGTTIEDIRIHFVLVESEWNDGQTIEHLSAVDTIAEPCGCAMNYLCGEFSGKMTTLSTC